MSWPVVVLLVNIAILSMISLTLLAKYLEWKRLANYYEEEANRLSGAFMRRNRDYFFEKELNITLRQRLDRYEHTDQQKQLNSNERGIEL